MGLLNAMRMRKYDAAIKASSFVVDPSTYPIASPWSSSQLNQIVADDVFGGAVPINTRAAAMRIPAVARARNLLVSSIARNPLVALRVDQRVTPQPTWLQGQAGGASAQIRNAWTVDDLIFYGWSCWYRDNAADSFPLAGSRVPMGEWSINADNQVEINGIVQDPRNVIVIPGMWEGILTAGVDALNDARTLYENVRKRLAHPVPGLNLQQTEGPDLTDDEIDNLISIWAAARRGDHAGVSFTSKGITATPMGSDDDGKLMIESRNAAAVDLARLVGVSAGLIDATTPKASLNYETQSGRNEEFVDRDLGLYMLPIEWRLSMDDVSPHGTRVAFDLTGFTSPTPSPTTPGLED
ncbi:MAG TPA: phage portal protein [Nocardioides sp.]|nr:phage portal protein [Nocardioides sp.]